MTCVGRGLAVCVSGKLAGLSMHGSFWFLSLYMYVSRSGPGTFCVSVTAWLDMGIGG